MPRLQGKCARRQSMDRGYGDINEVPDKWYSLEIGTVARCNMWYGGTMGRCGKWHGGTVLQRAWWDFVAGCRVTWRHFSTVVLRWRTRYQGDTVATRRWQRHGDTGSKWQGGMVAVWHDLLVM